MAKPWLSRIPHPGWPGFCVTFRVTFCLLCCVLLCQPVQARQPRWAQVGDNVFQFFGGERGLPHPIVTALAEDADGMLWVGTQGGLARWDGYRFRHYQPDPRQPGSLPDNYIQALHKDVHGNLWVGSSGGGVSRYIRKHDNFEIFPVGENGSSHIAVNAFSDDGQGGIWIGSNDGLDHYHPQTGKFSHFYRRHGLPDNQIYTLLLQKDGSLLIGTAKGLAYLPPLTQPGASSVPPFEVLTMPGMGSHATAVHALLQADDGAVWVGSSYHGLFLLHGKKLEALHQNMPEAVSVAQEFIYSLAQVRPGLIWAGTYGQGILAIDLEARTVRRIKRDPLQPRGLADDTVWCLLRGRGGFLWVGNQRGLQLHDNGQRTILSMFGMTQRAQGLTDPDVFSVLSLPNGNIWLGLGGNGIDIIDPRDMRVRGLRPNPALGDKGLSSHRVLALAALNEQVLIGTGLGLYRANQHTLELEKMAQGNELAVADVRTILVNGDGIWTGGFQSGLWWRPLHADSKLVPQRPAGANALSDHRVSVLASASQGRLWVGTRNGLNLLDPENGKVEHILPNPADPQALSAGLVLSLLEDRQGRLWVGTLGGGISILHKRDGQGRPQFIRLGLEAGLPNMNVAKLLQDENGKVWASTDNGLARIDPQTFKIHPLQTAEGVPITAYWGDSGAKTDAGELLFGGTGGLTIVRPQFFQEWQYQPPLVVTEVRVAGKPIPGLQFNRAYQGQHVPELVLQPGEDHLSVEFAALDYSAPERLRYMYRLDGHDRDWIETETGRRLAVYTNLPPGSYRLHMRGSNRVGNFPAQDLILPITVLPAWHQTWWFSTTKIGFLLLGVVLLLRFSTHYLRQRQRELENQVSQRTAQLQDKQDQLLHAISGLNQANQELALSADTLRQLGDVGRDITANLDAERVFEALHQHTGNLLDASTLVIYRSDPAGQHLTRCFGREDGKALPSIDIALDSPTSHTARAVRERREILLERTPEQAVPRIGGSRLMLTSLFAPLIIDTHVLGVMAIQSERAHAYGERERMIFRTLCGYGAIALANAEVLAALHAAQAQLVQQEKLAALGGLVTGMAHEINTPLGVTILALSGIRQSWQSLTQEDANLPVELQGALVDGMSYTDLAMHNANRAAALITSFQAITAHFDSDYAERLDLTTYLPEVAALLQAEFTHRGQQMHIQVTPGLHIHTVAAALTEALGRILANVHDHAFAPDQEGAVWLSAVQATDGWVEICVRDNGRGIPAAALPKVFDPFFTSAAGSSGHVGLGLHVAYNHVVQRLHGRIVIDSVEGQGTRVTLRLPPNPPEESADTE